MAKLTQGNVYTIAVIMGLKKPHMMAAIAMAESSGETTVVNEIGCVGLWQINQPEWVKSHPSWTQAWLKNPFNNARAAKAVYEAQGFGAWEAYTNGAYKKYENDSVKGELKPGDLGMTQKQFDDAIKGQPGVVEEGGNDGLFGGASDAIDAAVTAGKAVAKAGDWISSPSNWIRIAYVIGGMALTIGGLVLIGRPLIEAAAATTPVGTISKFAKGAAK